MNGKLGGRFSAIFLGLVLSGSGHAALGQVAFEHTASPSSLMANSTFLDHPACNGNPDALVFVEPVHAEGEPGTSGQVGVWFDGSRWAIFNQNTSMAMSAGMRFHVLVLAGSFSGTEPAQARAYVHEANSGNTSGHITRINEGFTNGDRGTVLIITQNWGDSGPYNDHPVGVWHDGNVFTIYNEDLAPMPNGARFNVLAVSPGAPAPLSGAAASVGRFTTGASGPVSGQSSWVFVTHDYGTQGPYHHSAEAVRWTGGDWRIDNQDGSAAPPGLTFNYLSIAAASSAPLAPPASAAPSAYPGVDLPGADTVPETNLDRDQLAREALEDMQNPSFEEGLAGWEPSPELGTAFDRQPVFGDNVIASRVLHDMEYANGGIGGDYWKRIPYPIGHQGDHWIGTYERRAPLAEPTGQIQGDDPQGALVSRPFRLKTDYLHFLIGGGRSEGVGVALLIPSHQYDGLPRRPPRVAGLSGSGWTAVLDSHGNDRETLRREVWNLRETLGLGGSELRARGLLAKILIYDYDSGGWGHVNADDFRFSNEAPETFTVEENGVPVRTS